MAIVKKSADIKAGKAMEKKEHSYTVSRNVNWCKHYGKQYGGSLRN